MIISFSYVLSSPDDLTAALALQPALKFNGGGHINHTIFWKNLSPNGGGEPQGKMQASNYEYVESGLGLSILSL